MDKALDFDSFLNNTLVNEVQISQPGFNILRRRIAILISQWTPVKLATDNRPTVYRIMQHLMNKDDPLNDLVVRVTAARCLRCSVDDWEFRVEHFLPFVPDAFKKIMELIDEVEETETKMSLLNVIACIVESLQGQVAPFADQIVQILPPLWEQTGDEHLFKQAILSVLAKLITAMKEDSLKYNHMVIPLLQYSVDPRNVSSLNIILVVQKFSSRLTKPCLTNIGLASLSSRRCSRALGCHNQVHTIHLRTGASWAGGIHFPLHGY